MVPPSCGGSSGSRSLCHLSVICLVVLSLLVMKKRERAQAPRGPLRVQGDSCACAGRSCGVVVSVSVSVSAINSCDAGQAGRRVVQSERARSVVSSAWLSSASCRGPPGGVRG